MVQTVRSIGMKNNDHFGTNSKDISGNILPLRPNICSSLAWPRPVLLPWQLVVWGHRNAHNNRIKSKRNHRLYLDNCFVSFTKSSKICQHPTEAALAVIKRKKMVV
jgi:hypothetical protein